MSTPEIDRRGISRWFTHFESDVSVPARKKKKKRRKGGWNKISSPWTFHPDSSSSLNPILKSQVVQSRILGVVCFALLYAPAPKRPDRRGTQGKRGKYTHTVPTLDPLLVCMYIHPNRHIRTIDTCWHCSRTKLSRSKKPPHAPHPKS